MSEHGRFESHNNPDDSSKKESKKGGMTRRAFILGAAGLGGVAIVEGTGIRKTAGRWYEKYKEDEFNENVEKEKGEVRKDIAIGLKSEQKFDDLLSRYNNIAKQLRHLDKQSDAYKEMAHEARNLSWEIGKFYVRRGTHAYGLLAEANSSAEKLGENDSAILALSVARVLYREGVSADIFERRELQYWHNCSMAYLELENKSPEQIKAKFKALFEYARAEGIKISKMPLEQILYSLIDDDFDFSLKSADVESVLNNNFPTWKQFLPTHNNKDSYGHYNDLSVLNIFDLNRLKAIMVQLRNRTFVSDIFRYRDDDLKDTSTELGGIIPLPHKENNLRVVPATNTGDNDAYVVPNKLTVELFAGVAGFHFHATKMQETPNAQGPSGGDHAFFSPGVVFSSINDSTILVHFYVSRDGKDIQGKRQVKNDVVCLGEIKKNLE